MNEALIYSNDNTANQRYRKHGEFYKMSSIAIPEQKILESSYLSHL